MPALLALACATEGVSPDTARADYARAMTTAKRDPESAIAQLEALRQEDPKGPLANEIALSLAQLYRDRGEEAQAAVALERGLKGQPTGDRSDEARLQLARIEARRGRRETAYKVLAPVRFKNLTPAQRREALQLLADLSAARRDYVTEIFWLAGVRAEAPDPDAVALVDVEIDERLGGLSRPDLDKLAEKLRGAVPAGRVRIREAEVSLQLGQIEAASAALSKAAALALTKADAARLARVEKELVSKGGKLARTAESTPPAEDATGSAAGEAGTSVGVLLPLTGRFAKFGEESLKGVLLAAGVFGENPLPGTSGLRLLVRDTGSGPGAAAQAVSELSSDPSVTAVIGPLLSEEADGAAAAAESAGLPLITLSGKESAETQGQHVFRLGATARSEVEAVAGYSIKTLGLKRFGILYPEDAYGRGLRDLFQEAVKTGGGSVVRVVAYEPRPRDLTAPVREVLGAPGRPGAPASLDAVFVADSRSEGIATAKALVAAGAGGVRVLGTRGWQSPDLLRFGGTAVEGAIFSEPFDPASSSPTVANFMRSFRQSYGGQPDVMAAQAYDATRVLLSAMPPGSRSRQELEERLRRVRGYPGASGTITVEEDGRVVKAPALRGVRSGRIVELQ